MKFNMGRAKFYMERLKNYYAWIQSGMITWLFFKQSSTNLWWILLAIPIAIIILWFDYKFVLTHELNEGLERNVPFKQIMSQLANFLDRESKRNGNNSRDI